MLHSNLLCHWLGAYMHKMIPEFKICNSSHKDPFVKINVSKQRFSETGGRLNKKDGLTRYGDSHVKDKTS